VHHWYQRNRWQIFPFSLVDTSGKFAAGVNNVGGKLPPISTAPVAKLPPLSTTPVANKGNNYQTAYSLTRT
jgi:hypothetical protein